MNDKIKLSGVSETMLQTVYARAKESAGREAIRDKKAEEIIGNLDYDFSLADKDAAMHSGVIARTILLDRLTDGWIADNPGATVVNIACGLDTRCYRISGFAHWYNLDLPDGSMCGAGCCLKAAVFRRCRCRRRCTFTSTSRAANGQRTSPHRLFTVMATNTYHRRRAM